MLPLGKKYGYFIDKNDYFPVSNHVDLRKVTEPVKIEENIGMTTIADMIADEKAVTAKNLFFDSGKSELLPSSKPELQRIAKIIKKNNLKTEISGHTDNTGEKKANQNLSELRANSVKSYLLQLGCSENLLTAKGFGETKPIATNNNAKNKSKNRRVEIRFKK